MTEPAMAKIGRVGNTKTEGKYIKVGDYSRNNPDSKQAL
jgi:hypothetical protein